MQDHVGEPGGVGRGLKGLDTESLRAIIQHNPDGILFTSPQGTILAANPAACTILRATEEEIIRRRGRGSFLDEHDPRWKAAAEALEVTGQCRAELPMIRADGALFMAHVSSCAFTSIHGAPRACLIFRDISETVALEYAQEHLVEDLEELVALDDLTAVRNRRGFALAGGDLLRVADRIGAVVHALFIDVNGLKHLNDEQGHDAGDSALVLVADVLRQTARSSDFVGRLGGDEFGVLLLGSGEHGAKTFIKRVETLLDERSRGEVTVSIGVAIRAPGSDLDLRELLRRADMRMYEARSLKREDAV